MGQHLERRSPSLRMAQERRRDLRQPRLLLPTNLGIGRLVDCQVFPHGPATRRLDDKRDGLVNVSAKTGRPVPVCLGTCALRCLPWLLQFFPRADAQLRVGGCQVAFHGFHGYEQPVGDLLIGGATKSAAPSASENAAEKASRKVAKRASKKATAKKTA